MQKLDKLKETEFATQKIEAVQKPHSLIEKMLKAMSKWKASDLFLCENKFPAVRVHGKIIGIDTQITTPDEMNFFFEHHLSEFHRRRFNEKNELDIGYTDLEGSRFRMNVSMQQGMRSLVIRALPSGELLFGELGLPESIVAFSEEPRGLVLITGATGSGKSTTLAAMLHYINVTQAKHIVTIEDPIEFVHKDLKSRVSQREVGSDTGNFHDAIRNVVRQSPDIIMLGEMRDFETVSVALSAALTGHLVLATLHTSNTIQTLQRILSFYPEHMRTQAALDLSISLKGILSQRLIPNKEGKGRVVATEVLTVSPAAQRLIREHRIEELEDLMRGTNDPGMGTFNQSLLRLFKDNQISYDVGHTYATNPDEFALSAQGMATGITQFLEDAGHEAQINLDMKSLLTLALERNASDLHISVGRPPTLRINGEIVPLPLKSLTSGDLRVLLYSILSGRQRSLYELEREIDFALSLENGQRFRVNAYFHKGRMAAALRAIPIEIPDADSLGLPKTFLNLGKQSQGLLLVVGPTGSGKTTSMACLLDRINSTRACRIITIEDPIEYVHESKKATIDQRELYADTKSFSAALRYILRQDPDVIMVGEMRDLETITAALTAAETGHLVIATLHTNDAVQAIDRIIDAFPGSQQGQIRSQLSSALLGIVSQRLLPRKDVEGRVAAFEIMLANSAIRHLIRDNKMHQAFSTIETSYADGMITLDRSLKELYDAGHISQESALRYIRNAAVLYTPSAVNNTRPKLTFD